MNKNDNEMFMTEHLAALRKTVIVIAAALVLCSGIMFFFSDILLRSVISGAGYDFIYTSPEMIAVQKLKLALAAGVVLSLPVSLTAVWWFIRPAANRREKRLLSGLITAGSVLFFSGVVFAYKIIFPVMIKFFKSIEVTGIKAYISVSSYIDLLLMVCTVFGITFELPIAMNLLVRTGIVDKDFFCGVRKYAVILIFVISALITPSDVFSMIMTAVPLILIYEIGIVSVKISGAKKSDDL